jgi:hypothetical protein
MPATPRERILIDLAIATGRGLGDKPIEWDAVSHWADYYADTVQKALDAGHAWGSTTRVAPLRVGTILGRTAAALAGGVDVNKEFAERATAAIDDHPLCGGGGSGEWCRK